MSETSDATSTVSSAADNPVTSSQTLTPSQMVSLLGYTDAGNVATATQIADSSGLANIQLAILGDLMLCETGPYLDTDAFAITSPVTGGNAGKSGWAIGMIQNDFTAARTTANTVLENALAASGNSQLAAASTGIAAALDNASSSQTMFDGYSLDQINAALGTAGGEQSLIASAASGVAKICSEIAEFTNNLTNASVVAALTPSNVAFNPTAYIALADYANQFGLNPDSTPFLELLNTGTTTFAYTNSAGVTETGATITIPGGTTLLDSNLATYIQLAEYGTYYAAPNGIPKQSAENGLATRINDQTQLGSGFDADNGIDQLYNIQYVFSSGNNTIFQMSGQWIPDTTFEAQWASTIAIPEDVAVLDQYFWGSQVSQTGYVESGTWTGRDVFEPYVDSSSGDYAIGVIPSDLEQGSGAEGLSDELDLSIQGGSTQQDFNLSLNDAQTLYNAVVASLETPTSAALAATKSAIGQDLTQLSYYYSNHPADIGATSGGSSETLIDISDFQQKGLGGVFNPMTFSSTAEAEMFLVNYFDPLADKYAIEQWFTGAQLNSSYTGKPLPLASGSSLSTLNTFLSQGTLFDEAQNQSTLALIESAAASVGPEFSYPFYSMAPTTDPRATPSIPGETVAQSGKPDPTIFQAPAEQAMTTTATSNMASRAPSIEVFSGRHDAIHHPIVAIT